MADESMKLFYKGLLAALTAAMFVLTGWMIVSSAEDPVRINEVCSNNFNLLMDEQGEYSDYIELYNKSTETISLEDYFLSDDENHPDKYPLGDITIAPGGYYVIWLDGKDDIPAGRSGFRIARMGEEIFLSRKAQTEGEPVVVDSVIVPALPYNISYGRIQDGEKGWGQMEASAGSTNNGAYPVLPAELDDPVFSAESGFYDEPFSLSITASEKEKIYYTLDGSEPTLNSLLYQGELAIEDVSGKENIYAARSDLSPTTDYVPDFPVDKAVVVRAISYDSRKKAVSRIATGIYFVGYEQKREYQGLPVISLVTDPGHLFDAERGIYGNGLAMEEYREMGGLEEGELPDQFVDEEGETHYLYMASNAFHAGKEWEREAVLTWFDERHEYGFTQNVGIRIAGQSTRGTPKKSFNIYGRDIYDEKVFFPCEFCPETVYSSVKLRNGGNADKGPVITDAFLESLAEERNVSIQRARPCILFLNGEYWGIYNIRERYKEEYLENHFGVSESNVWIIDAGTARVGEGQAQEAYEEMTTLVTECDLSYDDVYAMVSEFIDVQSLIDYCCINLYVDNRDVSFATNTALWRTAEPDNTEYGDCRWRWMVFDLDDSLQEDSNTSRTWIEDSALLNEPVVQSLMANEGFIKQFCISFMDIANTIYSYERVQEELRRWEEVCGEQIVKTHQRFFDENFTRESFDAYMEASDTFFSHRFASAMEGMAEYFGLTGTLEKVSVEINEPEGGSVMLNTAVIREGEWSGEYFTDYPLLLTAIPEEGYEFAGWAGDVAVAEEQIEAAIPRGGLRVEAIFEKAE